MAEGPFVLLFAELQNQQQQHMPGRARSIESGALLVRAL